MSTLITAALLRRKKACEAAVATFEREWPGGAEITVANVLRAMELGLDVPGWGKVLLPSPARKAYDEAMARARKAYDEAVAPAWKAYEEAVAPAWKAIAPARKAYDEAVAPAWKAYEEAIAPAWVLAALSIQEALGIEEGLL